MIAIAAGASHRWVASAWYSTRSRRRDRSASPVVNGCVSRVKARRTRTPGREEQCLQERWVTEALDRAVEGTRDIAQQGTRDLRSDSIRLKVLDAALWTFATA